MRLCRSGLYAHRSAAKSASQHGGREDVVLRNVLQWLHEAVRPRRRALVLARNGCSLLAVSPVGSAVHHRPPRMAVNPSSRFRKGLSETPDNGVWGIVAGCPSWLVAAPSRPKR